MASADLLQELNDDLVKAYSSVQSKGGTVPEHKNSNNLSTAIDSISGGGSTPSHDIPEFDGGQYGAIAYLLPGESEIKYYTAKTADELKVNNSLETNNMITVTLEDGTPIPRNCVLAYSIGSADARIKATYFLGYFYKLEKLYGLERYTGNITNNFLYCCYAFNQPITLSSSITYVGRDFMTRCYSFNQPVTMPSVSYTGGNFLYNCCSFNQPISLPALTNDGGDFLGLCASFNQPINLPALKIVGNNFLVNCYSFNQPISLPSSITTIGQGFLQNCWSLTSPLDVGTVAPPTDNGSLGMANKTVPAYATGITITGANAQAWRDALPDKDSTSPYRKLILGGGSDLPDSIDISKPLDEDTLSDIKKVVAAGKAQDYFKLGDELLVNYSSYVMPFEVVGFEDVETDNGVKPALNLLAKYSSEDTTNWGSSSAKYSASTLRTNITSTYQGKLDTNFIDCLANTKVQTYSRDTTTDIVYDKLFAPSMEQLGVTNASYNNAQQSAVEGPAFTAYKGAVNTKRAKQTIDNIGTAQTYWTRSVRSDSSNTFGCIIASGAPLDLTNNLPTHVVTACNLVGD